MKLKMSFKGHFLPIILVTVVFINTSKSQTTKVNVGDKFPDIELKGLINYKDSTVNLSALKGKLIILDIWSNWCKSCMNAMPHLQELQDKFGDRIQIFTVNPFSAKEDVISRIKSNNVIKNLRLPCITDTLLNMNNYFTYNSIPTEIWIDQTGIVAGITHAEYVNESNIKTLLEGGKVNFKAKISAIFDPSKLLLNKANNLIPEPFYYSVLTKYVDGDDQVRTGMELSLVKDTSRKVSRTLQINSSIITLYTRAFSKEFPWLADNNRTIVETRDSSRFFYNRKRDGYQDVWDLNNLFCYEAVLPFETSPEEYCALLRQDLNRYLNLNGMIESRNVPVWLVVKNKDSSKRLYIPSQPKYKEHLSDYKSLKDLVRALNQILPIPCINGVASTDFINVKASSAALTDINEIRAILKSIGLNIISSKRMMPMLVISEKNNQKQITK